MSNPEFKSGQGFTKADWDAVDSPPLTKAELAQARPFAEVFPELAEKMRKSLAAARRWRGRGAR
jgi:hypothetical protein